MEVSKNLKVLVIGDECRDVFVTGKVTRLSPEAPIPVLNPTEVKENPGMAGNVNANLKAMGYDPILISNMQPIHDRSANYETTEIVKTRYVDDQTGYILLRVDENDSVDKTYTKELLNKKLDWYSKNVIYYNTMVNSLQKERRPKNAISESKPVGTITDHRNVSFVCIDNHTAASSVNII